MHDFWKKNGVALLVSVTLAIIIFKLLFTIPNAGYANNGDFARVIAPFAMDYITEEWDLKYFNYAHLQYSIENAFAFGLPTGSSAALATSQWFAVAIAKLLNVIFFSTTVFDMRFMAALYYVVFLAAVFFIVKGFRMPATTRGRVLFILMAVFFIFAAGDAKNITYFNSFYSEAFTYVSFFAALAFAIWLFKTDGKSRGVIFAGFILAAIAFCTSKPQYTVLAVPIALAVILYNIAAKRRVTLSVILPCIIALALSSFVYSRVPAKISSDTLFNSVFNGILKSGENLDGKLNELGLDERFAKYAGTQVYYFYGEDDFNDMAAEFRSRVSRGDVLRYYLKHPREFMTRMEHTALVSLDNVGGDDLGNFDFSQNPEPNVKNNFFLFYSRLKQYLPHTLWFIMLFYLLYVAALIFAYRRIKPEERGIIWILATVALMGISQFPLPALANGETDVGKQLFFFNLAFDISLLGLLGIGLWSLYCPFNGFLAKVGQKFVRLPEVPAPEEPPACG